MSFYKSEKYYIFRKDLSVWTDIVNSNRLADQVLNNFFL